MSWRVEGWAGRASETARYEEAWLLVDSVCDTGWIRKVSPSTWPCLILFTSSVLPLTLMFCFGTPEIINNLLSQSSTDLTFLWARDMSGLIEISGRFDGFFRLLRTEITSWDLTNLTITGRSLSDLYLPSLKQSWTDWGDVLESSEVSILQTSDRSFVPLLYLGATLSGRKLGRFGQTHDQ